MRRHRSIFGAVLLAAVVSASAPCCGSIVPLVILERVIIESDMAVVGSLSDPRTASAEGVWMADLTVESVLFGRVDPGDTLRLFWTDRRPGGASGVPPLTEGRRVGELCLWLLNRREEGGIAEPRLGSVISLESEDEVAKNLHRLRGLTFWVRGNHRTELIDSYLSGYLTGRRFQGRQE